MKVAADIVLTATTKKRIQLALTKVFGMIIEIIYMEYRQY